MASRWRGWVIAGCGCAFSALSSCSADSTAMGSDAATPSPSGEAAVGGDAVDALASVEASGGVDGAAIVDARGAGVDALANDAGPPTRDGALPALDRPEPGTDAPATSPAPPEPSARPQSDPYRTLTPTIEGTGGPDTIRGTPGRDVIFAGDGQRSPPLGSRDRSFRITGIRTKPLRGSFALRDGADRDVSTVAHHPA